jgi:hypothetical protein
MTSALHYLGFDRSEGDDGVTTLQAMASSATAAQNEAVLREAACVLDWAWQHFGHRHGPVEDGMDWDHDLQVTAEDGGWHTVTLTLGASPAFVAAFEQAFGTGAD